MQDAALNFLCHTRSLIEAAERGLIVDEDLVAGRNAVNELLELDWVMPRVVAHVSMQWKVIEEALTAARANRATAQMPSEYLQAAWTAYRDLENVFTDHD